MPSSAAEYASANLLWAPDPQRPDRRRSCSGASRTDNDGNKGEDIRIQFSFKVSFSSKDSERCNQLGSGKMTMEQLQVRSPLDDGRE